MHWQVSTPYLSSSFFFFFKWERNENFDRQHVNLETLSLVRNLRFEQKFSKDVQCIVIYVLEQNHKANGTDLSCDCYCDLEPSFSLFFLLVKCKVNVIYAYYIKLRIYGENGFFFIVPHFTTMQYFSKFDNTFQKLKYTYPLKRFEKRKCILIFR